MSDESHDMPAIERAVRAAGGKARLARLMGVSSVMVHKWVTGRSKVTAERARQMEQVLERQVTRHELRPDVFDPPATERAEGAA